MPEVRNTRVLEWRPWAAGATIESRTLRPTVRAAVADAVAEVGRERTGTLLMFLSGNHADKAGEAVAAARERVPGATVAAAH